MMRSRLALSLAAAALLTLGACGSDDSDSDSTTPTTAASAATAAPAGGGTSTDEQSPVTVTDETLAPLDTSDVVTDDSDGPDPGDPDFSIPEGTSEECTNLYNKVMSAVPDGASSDDSEAMRRFVEVFESLKQDLPADLHDDLDVLKQAYGDYADAVDAYEGDAAGQASDPAVLAATEAISSDEAETANDNISTYLDEACPTLAS